MITLKNITHALPGAELTGNFSAQINEVIQLDITNKRDDVICWCNDKNLDKLSSCTAGTIICSFKAKELPLNKNCNFVFVENPRQAFSKILKDFFIPNEEAPGISAKASVHPSAIIGKNVYVGDFTVIERDCVIGDNCSIGHNNVLYRKTILGSSVKIGSNNTIGGMGFGYEKDAEGNHELIPHIGNVILKDRVEIGNGVTIDRAVLGSTILNQGVKLDNQVHVAHGVVIGEHSLLTANVMIAGSAVIGKNVWLSPSVSIINKGIVEDEAFVGMGAVVIRHVKEKTVVAGNPAKFLKDI